MTIGKAYLRYYPQTEIMVLRLCKIKLSDESGFWISEELPMPHVNKLLSTFDRCSCDLRYLIWALAVVNLVAETKVFVSRFKYRPVSSTVCLGAHRSRTNDLPWR
jgi:hypothetical protein